MSKDREPGKGGWNIGGVVTGVKDWFSGLKSGWKIPAAVGLVCAVTISGPVGLGVAGGMWAASRVRGDGVTDKAKNAALMTVGAGTCAASTAIGATIGSFIFPIVGTLFGAGVGLVGGMIASRKVTQKVKEEYKMDNSAPTSTVHRKEERKEKGGRSKSAPARQSQKARNKEALIKASKAMGYSTESDSESESEDEGKYTRQERNRRAMIKAGKVMRKARRGRER